MPDRAVVDEKAVRAALQKAWDTGCDGCGGMMVMRADIGDMRCQQCGRTGDDIERELRADALSPDRAVADRRTYCQDLLDDLSGIEGARAAAARNRARRCIKETEPQPRAIVALSEDRQWLCVLDKESRWALTDDILWSIYGWDTNESLYLFVKNTQDTGQDAHEVLRAWLEGREG